MLPGFRLTISGGNLDQIVIYHEVFIEKVYDLSLVTFAPEIVLDCGGFEGYFSLLARAAFPESRILAFEPNTANYRSMCANFQRNGIRIEAHPEAVSVFDGAMPLSGNGCGAHLGLSVGATRVQVTNLVRILNSLAPERLLLKLDVEGEEAKILPQILLHLPATTAIFFEWHHQEDDFYRLQALLEDCGFTVHTTRIRYGGQGNVLLDAFALRTNC